MRRALVGSPIYQSTLQEEIHQELGLILIDFQVEGSPQKSLGQGYKVTIYLNIKRRRRCRALLLDYVDLNSSLVF